MSRHDTARRDSTAVSWNDAATEVTAHEHIPASLRPLSGPDASRHSSSTPVPPLSACLCPGGGAALPWNRQHALPTSSCVYTHMGCTTAALQHLNAFTKPSWHHVQPTKRP